MVIGYRDIVGIGIIICVCVRVVVCEVGCSRQNFWRPRTRTTPALQKLLKSWSLGVQGVGRW